MVVEFAERTFWEKATILHHETILSELVEEVEDKLIEVRNFCQEMMSN